MTVEFIGQALHLEDKSRPVLLEHEVRLLMFAVTETMAKAERVKYLFYNDIVRR